MCWCGCMIPKLIPMFFYSCTTGWTGEDCSARETTAETTTAPTAEPEVTPEPTNIPTTTQAKTYSMYRILVLS